MTCEPFPTSPYSPKNSPSFSGGESRTIRTRSETCTPPSPLPRTAPARRNIANPTVPAMPSETPPTTSPNAHDVSTIISVRFGPRRSTARPQAKLAATATIASESRMRFATVFVRPIASVATIAITTMIVLTASE